MQPQPKMDEIGALRFMLEWLDFSQKTIVIADRGYESYNTFAHFLENPNIDFLIRVKQSQSAMREIKKLPMMELDTDVSFTITTTQTNADKENGYILLQKAQAHRQAVQCEYAKQAVGLRIAVSDEIPRGTFPAPIWRL